MDWLADIAFFRKERIAARPEDSSGGRPNAPGSFALRLRKSSCLEESGIDFRADIG
jgi:hypothetical protein